MVSHARSERIATTIGPAQSGNLSSTWALTKGLASQTGDSFVSPGYWHGSVQLVLLCHLAEGLSPGTVSAVVNSGRVVFWAWQTFALLVSRWEMGGGRGTFSPAGISSGQFR